MSRTLVLAVSPGEIWAALAEDGALIGLRLERSFAAASVGAIFLGRVVALRPELPAALVDIGQMRPAFLDARDADRKRGLAGINEGQALIVELIKAARADKAAGLRILRESDPRHAAIAEKARQARPPVRLDDPEPAILRAARDFLAPRPERIIVDDRGAFAELRGCLTRTDPDLAARLEAYDGTLPVFAAEGLEEPIAAALAPQIALPGGGTLHIEQTHAATVIDVDSGAGAALTVNERAARMIARQILLRNLAGPIVIDFIAMKRREDRDAIAAALREAFAGQPDPPDLLGWTRLSHLELVRRRRGAALAELLYEQAPDGSVRKAALTIALEALRAVARAARAAPAQRFVLALHPDIAAALEEGEGLAARRFLEARLGRALALAADPQRARDAVDIGAS